MWIILKDCQTDAECIQNYPDHPICDLSEGKCTRYPVNMKPPKIFDKNDVCKQLYGDIFVYNKKAMVCTIPKCLAKSSKDYCPPPSKCWRGKEC